MLIFIELSHFHNLSDQCQFFNDINNKYIEQTAPFAIIIYSLHYSIINQQCLFVIDVIICASYV